ncbi:palmitoyl-protein thioesterase 1 [Patella vulgata]|uniref:palmitoyl-protein thioesterase 1 n=1 Tax=Patella vulgata TaxID=6465 RepID=UPI0021802CB5|nr:palmitoyl-protein thioesterase 1 [Patella vulgata]
MKITICFVLLCLVEITTQDPVPVVIWHGIGDSCCGRSIGSIKSLIEEQVQGIYVKSLEIGNNTTEDVNNGYLMNVNDQVTMACKLISNDSKLQNGYNALGFSQGGQFMRAVVQRCPTPRIFNFVSVGGQHQGVYGFPKCPGDNNTLCDIVRKLLSYGAYVSFVQDHLVPAEYWQDPLNLDEYRNKSVFLADINQERTKNPVYKENLLKLKNLVLVKFLQDTTVEPRESEWFGFYEPGQAKKLLTVFETPLYQQDWLGLKKLNDTGRLHFLSSDTDHQIFTHEWFISNIINKFFK